VPAIVLAVAGAALYIASSGFVFRKEAAAQSQAELLARTRNSVGGQLSTFEQLMIQKPKQTLDNATIVRLWKANVGTSVILQLIRTSNSDFDVTANSIIELKQAGLDETIILAMVDAAYRRH
jgi:hypothetical protein